MLTNHVWKLLDQCYLTLADTVWDNKKLKLANLIASLRILLFEIDASQINRRWKDRDQLDECLNCFERLELRYAKIKGKRYVNVLRKRKIHIFGQYISWTIAEATFSFFYIIYKQPRKIQDKLGSLAFQQKNWTATYIKQVKEYKILALKVSDKIEGFHHLWRLVNL